MAAALGEILLLRKELARLAIAVAGVEVYRNRDIDQHFLEAYPLSNPLLYKALAPKVGLLDAELIVALTEFHKNFQEAKTWLPLCRLDARIGNTAIRVPRCWSQRGMQSTASSLR